ncbi:MAG TPA: CoA transferase [Acidimicrobiales bacterium]
MNPRRSAREAAAGRRSGRPDASGDARSPGLAGLAGLTGRPGGPTVRLPAGLIPGVHRLTDAIARDSGELGTPLVVDADGVFCARADAAGLTRRGDVSCGGAGHLLRTADGWLAVSLPRPDDWETTAAWLHMAAPPEHGRWELIASRVSARAGAELVDGAVLLGLAVAVVGERAGDDDGPRVPSVPFGGVTVRDLGADDPTPQAADLTVVDLSALWAGPLAGSLLQRCGARVIKVESTERPDGSRRGPAAFFSSLNGSKELRNFDFRAPSGRRALLELVRRADVVITSARPRALDHLGLDPVAMVAAGGPRAWLAVTGYGDAPGSARRVAFGDDAAAAGGLVVWDRDGPCFCGDALADPVTGLAGAAALLALLRSGRRAVVVASMADVAGGLA